MMTNLVLLNGNWYVFSLLSLEIQIYLLGYGVVLKEDMYLKSNISFIISILA